MSLAGNSDRLSWVRNSSRKSSATHSYQCVYCFRLHIQTMVRMSVFGIFNVRTDADVCDCTRGHYGHRNIVRAGRWPREKNPLLHRGLEPASVLRLAFLSDDLPTELSPARPFHIPKFCAVVIVSSVCFFFSLVLSDNYISPLCAIRHCWRV